MIEWIEPDIQGRRSTAVPVSRAAILCFALDELDRI